MERFITKKLISWKNSPNHKPLIIRGARQVGKTWSVMEFGNDFFDGNIHVVDLEKHPDWHSVFEKDLNVKRILSELELFLNADIVPDRDILFFDEIQSCPMAIMALRYFYEEIADLHVIAAGSLLEFTLKDISFPVGRVQFIDMYPLSLAEYLHAMGKDKLAKVVMDMPQRLSDSVHQILLDEVKNYFLCGGMPECVKAYSENGKLKEVFEIQAQLVDTFRQDVSKYAPYADKNCLNSVLTTVSKSIGKQIVYTKLSELFSSKTNKKAFELLTNARLIHKVPSTSPAGLPLGVSVSIKRFKSIFLDIGLMNHLCGMNFSGEFNKADILSIYQGALAEQFVGQELIAAGSELFYWSRESKSSTAEVDFLISASGRIIPIEVKSGASGRLKSMHLLLREYLNIRNGYILSGASFSDIPEQKLIFIPLYYAFIVAKEIFKDFRNRL